MEDKIKELISKLTDQIEKFLKACKKAGDVTIDDVLKRLKSLKKTDLGVDSRANLPPIPDESCHPFLTKVATCSSKKLPLFKEILE